MKKLEKVKKIIAVVLCLCMMITGMVSVKKLYIPWKAERIIPM